MTRAFGITRILSKTLGARPWSRTITTSSCKLAPTQWGIIGAGNIANDFATCFYTLNPETHKIIACASRSKERAQKLANSYSIPNVYGSYEELGRNPDVDVVYVANDYWRHFDSSKLMLEMGKNVLCEKPICTNAQDMRKLADVARKSGKFCMEAIWSRCFPAYEHIRGLLKDNALGKPLQVHLTFGLLLERIYGDTALRADKQHSVTLDMGVYTVQICNMAFNHTKPKIVFISGTLDAKGNDDNVVVLLDYGEGRLANLTISWRCQLENSVIISCENASIKILEPFQAPSLIEVDGKALEFPLPESKHKFNYPNCIGLSYEIEHVGKCLEDGLKESPFISLQESVDIAEIIEKVRKEIGAKLVIPSKE